VGDQAARSPSSSPWSEVTITRGIFELTSLLLQLVEEEADLAVEGRRCNLSVGVVAEGRNASSLIRLWASSDGAGFSLSAKLLETSPRTSICSEAGREAIPKRNSGLSGEDVRGGCAS